MEVAYGWEKYYLAMIALGGNGPMKIRIQNAVSYNLIHVHDENLPPDMREQHQRIMRAVNAINAESGAGSIADTLSVRDEEELREIVTDIVAVYGGICHYRGKAEPR